MPTAAELKAMITKVKPLKVETELKTKDIKAKLKNKEIDKRQLDLLGIKVVRHKAPRINRKDFGGNGHWIFDEPMAQGKRFGFIYVIRDCETGKCYIGKKQYNGLGDKNMGVASNWPWYISSRDTLIAQIKAIGRENFEFIVLEEYNSNKALGYAETWSLMHAETPSNQDKWYNRLVNKVSWFCSESITQRHKDRLGMIIRDELFITLES